MEPRFRYKMYCKIKLSFSPFLTRNFARISAEMEKNVKIPARTFGARDFLFCRPLWCTKTLLLALPTDSRNALNW